MGFGSFDLVMMDTWALGVSISSLGAIGLMFFRSRYEGNIGVGSFDIVMRGIYYIGLGSFDLVIRGT